MTKIVFVCIIQLSTFVMDTETFVPHKSPDVHKGKMAEISEFTVDGKRVIISAFDHSKEVVGHPDSLEQFHRFAEKPNIDNTNRTVLVEGQGVVVLAENIFKNTPNYSDKEVFDRYGEQVSIAFLALKTGIKVESWDVQGDELYGRIEEKYGKEKTVLWLMSNSLSHLKTQGQIPSGDRAYDKIFQHIESKNGWNKGKFYQKYGLETYNIDELLQNEFGINMGELINDPDKLQEFIDLSKPTTYSSSDFSKTIVNISSFVQEYRDHNSLGKIDESIKNNSEVFISCEQKHMSNWVNELTLQSKESEIHEEVIDLETAQALNKNFAEADNLIHAWDGNDNKRDEREGIKQYDELKKSEDTKKMEIKVNQLCRKAFGGRSLNDEFTLRYSQIPQEQRGEILMHKILTEIGGDLVKGFEGDKLVIEADKFLSWEGKFLMSKRAYYQIPEQIR